MGILEVVYEYLVGFFGALQEGVYSSEQKSMLQSFGFYSSFLFAFAFILGYLATYIILTIAFVKGYKNKGYKDTWFCFIPIAHFYCFIKLLEVEKVWGMTKRVLTGIFMSIVGAYILFIILKDFIFFNDIFTYFGGGNIDLDQIDYNCFKGNKSGLYAYFNLMIWITEIAGAVLLIPILSNFFKPRTNKIIVCVVLGILLPTLPLAIMTLVLINKKAQPKVVYTTYYQGGYYGQNPFGNINPNAQNTQQEPFSEFGETKQEEPFSEFNNTQTSVDYVEQPEVETEKPQENTEQKVVENTTNAEPQQEQVDTTEDNDEDDLF